jgi:hypothetical protein
VNNTGFDWRWQPGYFARDPNLPLPPTPSGAQNNEEGWRVYRKQVKANRAAARTRPK